MGVAWDGRQESMMRDGTAIALAARLIAEADGLVIAAGAGMGTDSGMPDFRGNGGFWRAYPALATDGVAFMDIVSPGAVEADPYRAWGFYGHRLRLFRETRPHAGFSLLRKWGEAMRRGYFVFTSNVDGHFEKSGMDPLRIEEYHGSIHHLQCSRPCVQRIWNAEGFDPDVDTAQCRLLSALPACKHCGRTVRPNIRMFDDKNWLGTRHDRQAARCMEWLRGTRCPVVIEIGAGVNIETVRKFSERVVSQHRAALIRINPHAARIGNLPGVGIADSALKALRAIDALLERKLFA